MTSLAKTVMVQCSVVAKKFTFCRQKASYVASTGLGRLLAKQICSRVAESSSAFTMAFDETTIVQNKKQMDILLRYWSDCKKPVVTKYLVSFYFARVSADVIVDKFSEL